MLKVALVPSAVSDGAGARGLFLTSYLVNGRVAVDAGGLGLIGDLEEQGAVRDIFLTHSHLDHVASLPLWLDTHFGGPTVTIHAGEATLDSLRRDLFNGRVWPDFLGMNVGGRPLVELDVLEPYRPVEAGGLRWTPVPVDHVVPTLGLLVEAPDGTAVAIPSDTGPTVEFWERARAVEGLKGVFLECSFPDELGWLAGVSKHLTPGLFAAEARKLGRDVRLVAVHVKPRYYEAIVSELRGLGMEGVEVGVPGRVYSF